MTTQCGKAWDLGGRCVCRIGSNAHVSRREALETVLVAALLGLLGGGCVSRGPEGRLLWPFFCKREFSSLRYSFRIGAACPRSGFIPEVVY